MDLNLQIINLDVFNKLSFEVANFISNQLDILNRLDQSSQLPLFNFICEIQPNEYCKYQLDSKGVLVLDRLTKIRFQSYYGFIPDTLADDNDPIDVCLILSDLSENYIKTNSFLEIVPICLLQGIDNNEEDPKVIAISKAEYLRYKGNLNSNFDFVFNIFKIITFYNRYKNNKYIVNKLLSLNETINYINNKKI